MSAVYENLRVERRDSVVWVWFSRPEVHNAFHSGVIRDMRAVFASLAGGSDVRAVVLSGEGKSFCAGADLNWMRDVATFKYAQNLSEASELAELFHEITTCPLPVIGRINGAAIGGGAGFVAVCDIAIAAASAVISFSEVKIGLVPACIGPYVIRKTGEGSARELFITGERLSAERAAQVGLVNHVVPDEELDSFIGTLLDQIRSSGPKAIAMAKELIRTVPGMSPEQYRPYTAEMIARLRASQEGQEGMAAFLEKRRPIWRQ